MWPIRLPEPMAASRPETAPASSAAIYASEIAVATAAAGIVPARVSPTAAAAEIATAGIGRTRATPGIAAAAALIACVPTARRVGSARATPRVAATTGAPHRACRNY